jgi:hypothetical protein
LRFLDHFSLHAFVYDWQAVCRGKSGMNLSCAEMINWGWLIGLVSRSRRGRGRRDDGELAKMLAGRRME